MDSIMSLTVGQLVGGIAGIIVVLSVFIEITPVKINPVSHILTWIGKKTNKELMDKFVSINDKVNSLENTVNCIHNEEDKRNAINCRVRILGFGDEVRHGMRHSKESFDQVLSDIDDYELYCSEHPEFKNNRTVLTKKKILEEYSKCIDNNDFL